MNHTLVEKVRAIIFDTKPHKEVLGEDISISAYLLRSSSVDTTQSQISMATTPGENYIIRELTYQGYKL